MLWSCQFDDVLSTPSNEGVIRVTSSLTKAESTGGTTESTTNDNFKNNEIIYVWARKTDGGSTDDYIKAWELTATDTNGIFSGDSKAWPYDGKSLDFHALHGTRRSRSSISRHTRLILVELRFSMTQIISLQTVQSTGYSSNLLSK